MNHMNADKFKAKEEAELLSGEQKQKSDLGKKGIIALCVFAAVVVTVLIIALKLI